MTSLYFRSRFRTIASMSTYKVRVVGRALLLPDSIRIFGLPDPGVDVTEEPRVMTYCQCINVDHLVTGKP